MSEPIVLISSYPPCPGDVSVFCADARQFIQKHNPQRAVLVISHRGGSGEWVLPLIDTSSNQWWEPVVRKLRELDPYVVHVQHDYGLYERVGQGEDTAGNQGFLELLNALRDYPLVVEPHTIHARMGDAQAQFLHHLCEMADVVIFKCHYHKWRLDWTFPGLGFKTPTNIMIVPHGVRPDRRYGVHEVPQIRRDLHLDQVPGLSMHLVGLITTGYSNKRWDILTNIWEEIRREILARTGQEWDLLAAGAVDDTRHEADYKHYKDKVQQLEHKGLAHHYEFVPGEESYYKMMAVCDFIVLPSTDETQAGTLARIIALNKPFITSAPIEGLTAQTLESGGGLLFTNEHMLREAVLRLASDEGLRLRLGNQLKAYLDEVVSWDIVAGQYNQAYDHARNAKLCGASVDLPSEF